MPDPLRDWYHSAVTIEIAEKLLDADPGEPVRTDDVAKELARSERTIRDLFDRLYAGRLVARTRIQTGDPGRPPWGYWLSEEQRPGAQRAVDTPESLWAATQAQDDEPERDRVEETSARPEASDPKAHHSDADQIRGAEHHSAQSEWTPGLLEPGQELVIVDVSGSGFARLLEALAETQRAATATWFARIGDEVVFAFDPAAGATAAGDLLSVLAGARLTVRSDVVRHIAAATELIDQSRRMAPEIRRARSTSDAHQAQQ